MIKAKKSLGQNFLKAKKILDKIVETANLSPHDTVLEIGPGKGILTEQLLLQSQKVIAIEKDQRLIDFLQQKFATEIQNQKLTLISGDILALKPKNLVKPPYKIVANLPYYITGQFLRKFLSNDNQPTQIVVMLQKEVAQRIVAKDQKENLLSLSVKVYGKPCYITTVKAQNFLPQPKVDSAVLSIENISKDFFKKIDEQSFFTLIKKGFSNKRKMLINNLTLPKKELVEILEKLKIPLKTRAEDLSKNDWQILCFELKKHL